MNQALKDQRVQELISLYNNGDVKECLLRAKKVAKIYPEEPFVFNLIGVVSASIGSYEEAIESYKRALKINPNYFEVYNNLGVALNDFKKPKDAISYLRKALKINPHYPEAYNNLGNALKEIESLDQAIESYENAIKLNPKFIDPYTNLAIVFASKKNENEKAEYYFKKALEISPENSEALKYFSDFLVSIQRYSEAKALLEKCVILVPRNPDVLNLLGQVYKSENFEKALEFYNNALHLSEDKESIQNNIGALYFEFNKVKRAISYFKKISNSDGNTKTLLNLAYAYIADNQFKEGWEKYEYRWKVDPGDKVVWPLKDKPLWDGRSASGVLLWREQGIGDDIIFLGLVPEAYAKAGKDMTVLIDPRLVAMCKRSMPGIEFLPAVKGSVQEDRFNYHLPMGSLPRLFRSSEEDFSKTRESYLKADMERVEVLRKELGVEGKKVIGISWRSFSPINVERKSMDLEQFGRMFDGLDVVLLNLQYGDVNEEIRAFTKETGIEVLQCSSVNLKEDLDGLGALIALCDLVVSTSNVTIHMAGALGKEAWVLLPFAASFWWLIERTDSLWYPTVKLYRQKSLQDWSEILKNIEAQLKVEHINRFIN